MSAVIAHSMAELQRISSTLRAVVVLFFSFLQVSRQRCRNKDGETTLASRSFVSLCKLAKDRRYQICLTYFLADRKSTRLNSSHANISYAVFCLKKKISN